MLYFLFIMLDKVSKNGYNSGMLNNNIGNKMNTLYSKPQSENKIVEGVNARGSLTCYYNDDRDGEVIKLSALEEMWYTHEANIDHPVGSEYPVSINVPHMKLMRDRVFDSVLHRTGINIKDFDGVIHASSFGGVA